jgi:hypothetical protein
MNKKKQIFHKTATTTSKKRKNIDLVLDRISYVFCGYRLYMVSLFVAYKS